jgi:hypothetical protein
MCLQKILKALKISIVSYETSFKIRSKALPLTSIR